MNATDEIWESAEYQFMKCEILSNHIHSIHQQNQGTWACLHIETFLMKLRYVCKCTSERITDKNHGRYLLGNVNCLPRHRLVSNQQCISSGLQGQYRSCVPCSRIHLICHVDASCVSLHLLWLFLGDVFLYDFSQFRKPDRPVLSPSVANWSTGVTLNVLAGFCQTGPLVPRNSLVYCYDELKHQSSCSNHTLRVQMQLSSLGSIN